MRFAKYRLNQCFGTLFAQIEYALKASQAAVIGVGNFGEACFINVAEKQMNLVAVLARADADQIGEIGLVHGQDQIEFFEVLLPHPARFQSGNIVATGCRDLSCPWIGVFALAGRVRSC